MVQVNFNDFEPWFALLILFTCPWRPFPCALSSLKRAPSGQDMDLRLFEPGQVIFKEKSLGRRLGAKAAGFRQPFQPTNEWKEPSLFFVVVFFGGRVSIPGKKKTRQGVPQEVHVFVGVYVKQGSSWWFGCWM